MAHIVTILTNAVTWGVRMVTIAHWNMEGALTFPELIHVPVMTVIKWTVPTQRASLWTHALREELHRRFLKNFLGLVYESIIKEVC